MEIKTHWRIESIKKECDKLQEFINELQTNFAKFKDGVSQKLQPYQPITEWDFHSNSFTTIEEYQREKERLQLVLTHNLQIAQSNEEIYKVNLQIKEIMVQLIENTGWPRKSKKRKPRSTWDWIEVERPWYTDLEVVRPLTQYQIQSTYDSYIRTINEKILSIQAQQRKVEEEERRTQYLMAKGVILSKYSELTQKMNHYQIINKLEEIGTQDDIALLSNKYCGGL